MMTNLVNIVFTLMIFNKVTADIFKPNYVELLRSNSHISEDGKLDFMGLAKKYGHPAERHQVFTDDGYNLTLFHLPGNKKKAAVLVHGNGVDADLYITRGNTSMAITLADKDYDVWVVSLRGTYYSQNHLTIDVVKEPNRFFNYSFYEFGIYDVPATIDYVLKKTGQKKVLIIGFSMGTTAIFTMGAEKPEYNKKIKAYLAAAPYVYTKHQKGLIDISTKLGDSGKSLEKHSEVNGRNQLSTFLLQSFCLNPDNYFLCIKGLLFQLYGPDKKNFEPEFMRTLFGHFPGGSSEKQLKHPMQINKRDVFAQYDYGVVKNLEVYGSIAPPKIDLSKVTMKVALFVGKGDYIARIEDVERLAAELPHVVHFKILPYEKFNHFDFTYGRYMTENFYPYFMKIVDQYI